jgi:hypothetical protein
MLRLERFFEKITSLQEILKSITEKREDFGISSEFKQFGFDSILSKYDNIFLLIELEF